MLVGLLGPLYVEVDGRPVELGAAKERAVVCLLALAGGRPVTMAALVDGLWPGEPPPNARKAVQTYVARLRKRLPSGAIASAGDGYALDLDQVDVDAERFDRLRRQAGADLAAGRPDPARRGLVEALALWRGEALSDGGDSEVVGAARARLVEARRGVEEDLIEARLASGETASVVGDAEAAVVVEPLRERRWGQLMVALYRCGRQADALRAYQRCRQVLVDELGVEPGPELRALERSVLEQDRRLDAPPSATSPALPVRRGLPPVLRDALQTPMVGREALLGDLAAAWGAVVAGGRRTVLLAGEPGVGKTRLVAELASQTAADGGIVLVGRCRSELAVPYQPVAEALAPVLAGWSDDSPGRRLLASLSPARRDRDAPAGLLAAADPVLEQYQLFEDAVRAVMAVSLEAPTLVVMEDLHWASEPTRRLLRYLVGAPDMSRVLVAGTLRHTHGTELPALGGLPGVQRFVVGPLDLEETEELVRLRRREGSGSTTARIYELSGGNPLLVEQLLLDEAAGRPEPTGGPQRASEVIAGRLAGLDSATLRVLELAAVVGSEFDLAVLAAADGDAERVLDALEEAERAGLVVASTAALGRFAFCHALVRDVLADGLPVARRMRLHRTVAFALQDRVGPAGGADQAAVLARHFAAAAPLGLAKQAVAYATQAGDTARARLAFEEAAELYALGLSALESLPLSDADSGQSCDLLTARGEALRRAGVPEAAAVLADAARAARDLADAERLAGVVFAAHRGGHTSSPYGYASSIVPLVEDAVRLLGDKHAALRSRLLAVELAELAYSDDDRRRAVLSEQALSLGCAAGDPATLAHAIIGTLVGWSEPWDLAGRQGLADELVAIADDVGQLELRYRAHHLRAVIRLEGADLDGYIADRALARSLAAELHQPALDWEQLWTESADRSFSGDFTGAEQSFEEADRLGRRIGIPESTLTAMRVSGLGTVRWDQGRLTEWQPEAEELARLAPHAPWRFFLAMLPSERGEFDRAARELRRLAARNFADVARRYTWVFSLMFAAETAANLGDASVASTLLELLEPLSGRLMVAEHLRAGPVDRVLGRLCTAIGSYDRAAAYLSTSAELTRRAGAPLWATRTRLDMARLAQARGDRTGARAAAEQARDMALRFGATGLAQQAERLLSAC